MYTRRGVSRGFALLGLYVLVACDLSSTAAPNESTGTSSLPNSGNYQFTFTASGGQATVLEVLEAPLALTAEELLALSLLE